MKEFLIKVGKAVIVGVKTFSSKEIKLTEARVGLITSAVVVVVAIILLVLLISAIVLKAKVRKANKIKAYVKDSVEFFEVRGMKCVGVNKAMSNKSFHALEKLTSSRYFSYDKLGIYLCLKQNGEWFTVPECAKVEKAVAPKSGRDEKGRFLKGHKFAQKEIEDVWSDK